MTFMLSTRRIRKREWFSFYEFIPFESIYENIRLRLRLCRLGVDKSRKRYKKFRYRRGGTGRTLSRNVDA